MDTRENGRIVIEITVDCSIETHPDNIVALSCGEQFKVEAFDISRSGIGFFCGVLLPKGIHLEMAIGGISEDPSERIRTVAEIRYCLFQAKNPSVRRYKCGGMFLSMSDEDRTKLAAFIARNEQRKEPRLELG